MLEEDEFISFVKNGGMCKAFGCTMERLYQSSNLDSYMSLKCKYCGKDTGATWQQDVT